MVHGAATPEGNDCDNRGVRIALLGFGLIGGSLAKALRQPAAWEGPRPVVAAWSPSGHGPVAALRDGVIDEAAEAPISAVRGADLVVLAGPVPACLAMLDDLAIWGDTLAPGGVVTDVASTKVAMVLRATALGIRYVGGHPMAGRETSGYGAAAADLFADRPWVVVPGADADAVVRVETVARAVGARPLRMSAEDHDRAVAGISHLPLLAAAALVEAVAGSPGAARDGWADARALAATGWRDMTRLARGDVEMGTGIVTTNAPAIAARVRDLVATLERWADELERDGGPDPEAVRHHLARAKAMLEGTES